MTQLLVQVLSLFRSWVMKLPDLSIDPEHLSSIMSAKDLVIDFIAKANYIVPIDVILLILSIVFLFRFAKFTMFIINWVVRRIADIIP